MDNPPAQPEPSSNPKPPPGPEVHPPVLAPEPRTSHFELPTSDPPVIRLRPIHPAFDQALIEDKFGPGSKFFEEGLAREKAFLEQENQQRKTDPSP